MAQVAASDFVRRKAQRMDVSAGVSHLSWPPRRQRGSLRLPPPVSVPRLFLTDIVESVEDVAAVLEGVVLGTLQPLGIDHRQHLFAMGVFPLPGVADNAAPGDATDLL